MTVSLKRYVCKSRKLANKAQKSGQQTDYVKFRNYRNTLNQIKLHLKRTHYIELFNKIGKNSQLLWNVMNNLLRKSNDKQSVTELKYNGSVTSDSAEICNIFNEHFSHAGKETEKTVKSPMGRAPLQYVKRRNSKFSIPRISETQISSIVMKMKAKHSSGYDGVSNYLLKSLIHVIKLPLCVVFNKSLQTGVFPNLMKLAKLIPLHKGGERDVCDNYRPISLLPIISKILERHVHKHMVKFLDENHILYPHQFGFRERHSTTDVIMSLIGEMLKALDSDLMVLSLFIDLKTAFNMVPHSLILDKLKVMGVEGVALDWFRDFLTNRKHYVAINNCKSDQKTMDIGVAQGSTLSVLLFQLLINDLPKCLKFCTGILYADDTTIFVIGRSLKFLRMKMNKNLENLSDWLSVNRLKLNVKKTKVVLFNKENLNPHVDITFEGMEIECLQQFRFLGVLLDQSVSFESHFSMLYRKLMNYTFISRKLSQVLPSVCLKHLYYAFFHSNLMYGLVIWFPLLKERQHQTLCKLQKHSICILCQANFSDHCMPLFKKEEILVLSDQLKVENCKLMYKVSHEIIPPPIANLYNNREHDHNT